jgi:ATP phosphoribosyltransferase
VAPAPGDTLTIALTKGRILKETLPLLAAAGVEPLESIESSRKLIFETNHADLRLVILRGSDVCTYVRHGAAHVGCWNTAAMVYTSHLTWVSPGAV